MYVDLCVSPDTSRGRETSPFARSSAGASIWFTTAFYTGFAREAIRVIQKPMRTPVANAYCYCGLMHHYERTDLRPESE